MKYRLLNKKNNKRFAFFAVVTFLAAAAAPALGGLPEPGAANVNQIKFIPNQGQMNPEVLYYHQGARKQVFLTKSRISVLSWTGEGPRAVELVPEKIRDNCRVSGAEQLPGRVSYLKGSPTQWQADLPTYGGVLYEKLWPGIDLKFYAAAGQLEYDLIVEPGADPGAARFVLNGGDRLEIGLQGELIVSRKGEPLLVQKKPVAYQEWNGVRREVESWYVAEGSSFRIAVAEYDRNHTLIIDPLVFSIYVGGSDHEEINDLAIDSQGYIYAVGSSLSTDYPVTLPALGGSHSGSWDCVITRFAPDGGSIDRSTYLGGDQADACTAIAIRTNGEVIVGGYTGGGTFPVTTSGTTVPDSTHNGDRDIFVARLPYDLTSLRWATYLGGSDFDHVNDLALDASNNIYLAGQTESSDFPTSNAYQATRNGFQDALIVRLDDGYPTQVTVNFSTYLGGADDLTAVGERCQGIAVSDDAIFIGGYTSSSDFGTLGHNPKTTVGGFNDAFYGRLTLSGQPQFLSLLGGSGGEIDTVIDLAPGGEYFVLAGRTTSTDFVSTGFPGLPGYDQTHNGDIDMWVAGIKIELVSTISGPQYHAFPLFATYLGGSEEENYTRMAVGGDGSIFAGGRTFSDDFPVKKAFSATRNGSSSDMFVAKLSPDASNLVWSTYLGGNGSESLYALAADQDGGVVGGGYTSSLDYPTANAGTGLDSFHGGSADAVLFKIRQNASGAALLEFLLTAD